MKLNGNGLKQLVVKQTSGVVSKEGLNFGKSKGRQVSRCR